MRKTLGILAIVMAIKGFGGSFNALFGVAGIPDWHGPVVGALIAALLIAFYLSFLRLQPERAETGERPTRHWGIYAVFAVLFFAALFLRVRAIHDIPIDVGRCDDLPHVRAGLQKVMSGESPYQPLTLENGHVIPHYVLPVLWLSYLPLYALHLDVRYLNVFAQLLFYLLLFDCFLRANAYSDRKRLTLAFLVFIGLMALHVFSKQTIKEVVDLHTGPYWMFYSLFVWSVLRGFQRLTIAVVPLLLLCREPAFLFVAPYALHLFQRRREEFFQLSTATGAVIAALLLPILVTTPKFLFAATRHYAETMNAAPASVMTVFFGLSGVLKKLGLIGLQHPLQISGLVIAVWLQSKRPNLGDLAPLALGGVAYVCFMLFVPISGAYVFAEPLILAYFLSTSLPYRYDGRRHCHPVRSGMP